MAFNKKTIKDVPLAHKTVLLRADYNVPLNGSGQIDDDFRISQSLPTLHYLIQAGCKIIILSHLGRPEGRVDQKFSLEPVAHHLGELLKQPVGFVPNCIGDRVKVAAKHLTSGGVLLLENVRFYPEEEKNDPNFAKKIAQDSGAEYFIQDGFGVVHRAHATTQAITQFLPSVAGLLLAKEVSVIEQTMRKPKKPLVAVLGGAKVSDKISVIERLIPLADNIIIGGAMANIFLEYQGVKIGKSKTEANQSAVIERIYAGVRKKTADVNNFLVLPSDVAVAKEVSSSQRRQTVSADQVGNDEYILDLGPHSIERMLGIVKSAATVVWNGPLGVAEYSAFAWASAKLAHALAAQKPNTFSLIGGGDTADFVLHWDSQKGASFGHVSTGGGASLELMSGQALPGIEALMDK